MELAEEAVESVATEVDVGTTNGTALAEAAVEALLPEAVIILRAAILLGALMLVLEGGTIVALETLATALLHAVEETPDPGEEEEEKEEEETTVAAVVVAATVVPEETVAMGAATFEAEEAATAEAMVLEAVVLGAVMVGAVMLVELSDGPDDTGTRDSASATPTKAMCVGEGHE